MKVLSVLNIIYHFLLYPLLLISVGYLVMNGYGFISGKITQFFFPISHEKLEISKVIITSSWILILLEFFSFSKKINNYGASRMIGILVMFGGYFLITYFMEINLIFFIALAYLNSVVTIYIQKIKKLKYHHFIANVLFVLFCLYLILINFLL